MCHVILRWISYVLILAVPGSTLQLCQGQLNETHTQQHPKKLDLALLVSSYVAPSKNDVRMHEIFAAIGENLKNPHISQVHVLLDRTPPQEQDACDALFEFFLDGHNKLAQSMMDKLRCIVTMQESTYMDLFRYANTSLLGKAVILANADVVFDESMGLLQTNAFDGGRSGYVLSVMPPPISSKYKETFGQECHIGAPEDDHNKGMTNAPRCVLGRWDGDQWGQLYAGTSWDAYIFHPPLPATIKLEKMDYVTHLTRAENRALYQLAGNGQMKFYNPCKHIHAYHWHCHGGKSHGNLEHDLHILPQTDRQGMFNMYPCWDCPGVQMPESKVAFASLCQKGVSNGLTRTQSQLMKYPENVELCCAKESDCTLMDLSKLFLCNTATDVDCIMWHFD